MTGLEVYFIDTSVLLNLLRVPGRCDRAEEMESLLRERLNSGVNFIIPITTVIETGNLIQQCTGDRHAAAKRFRDALEAAAMSNPPWLIHNVSWDSTFITALICGDSTGSTLVEHFTSQMLGAGDLSILVERDLYATKRAITNVHIWTIDEKLGAYTGT